MFDVFKGLILCCIEEMMMMLEGKPRNRYYIAYERKDRTSERGLGKLLPRVVFRDDLGQHVNM